MSTIGGKKKESNGDFSKKVGLFEANVVAVNPDINHYTALSGMEVKEDSKAVEYLGESKDGNPYLRIDFWLEEVKTKANFKVSFFLEDKERTNKDGTKKQFINSVGACSWAGDENDLPDWFKARDYRVAYSGEEDFYNFLRTWLGNLDYRNAETTLNIDWKKLMKGNVKDLKDQIDGEWCTNVVALATVISKVKDDETKEYQGIYSRGFLSPYALRNFRLVDYSDLNVIEKLRTKKSKDLKPHERFVLQITGEYGCKDFYSLKELKEYDSSENMMSSDVLISDEDSADY